MNALSIRLVRASAVALALGILLAISFGVNRAWGATLRPLHAELNLFGWLTLLIYGMGFHMLPRFTGAPLSRPRLAEAQSWLAISGVALATLGWLPVPGAEVLRVVGGLLQGSAAVLFVTLIFPMLKLFPLREA
jgi:hypothetical protein